MKKAMKSTYLLWLLIVTSIANGYGQGPTGINTNTPQQQLHVAGTSDKPGTQIGTSGIYTIKPTIRIDGLNKANNNAVNGPYALPLLLTMPPYSWTASSWVQPVSVTQDGDLLLSRDYVIPLIATQVGSDALTATSFTAPGAPNPAPGVSIDGTLTGGTGYTFTIKQTCMVHFMASVSVSIYQAGAAGSTVLLTDGVNRAYNVFFRFTSASFTNPSGNPALITGATGFYQFGTEGNSYVNANTTGIAGDMYINPEAYLVLPPGTYNVDLWGRFFGYDYSFNAIVGGGTEDMISIMATPLN